MHGKLTAADRAVESTSQYLTGLDYGCGDGVVGLSRLYAHTKDSGRRWPWKRPGTSGGAEGLWHPLSSSRPCP